MIKLHQWGKLGKGNTWDVILFLQLPVSPQLFRNKGLKEKGGGIQGALEKWPIPIPELDRSSSR